MKSGGRGRKSRLWRQLVFLKLVLWRRHRAWKFG